MTVSSFAAEAGGPALQPLAAAPTPQRLRILVVDDHVESIEPLTRLLEMCGHTVTSAYSAADALGAAGRGRFELLMSDLDMPVTDGCELLVQLRAMYPLNAIAISAHTGERLAKQATAAGYQCLLIKPLRFDEVLEAISRLPPAKCTKASGD